MEMEQDDLEDLNELDAIFQDIGGNEKLEENSNTGFEDILDGEYSAEVIAAEFTRSKQNNTPMIKIEFGLEGQTGHIWDYLMLADKNGDYKKTSSAIARSVTKLRELGLDAKDLKGYVEQLPKLTGVTLTLKLETSKSGFQNKHYENVDKSIVK